MDNQPSVTSIPMEVSDSAARGISSVASSSSAQPVKKHSRRDLSLNALQELGRSIHTAWLQPPCDHHQDLSGMPLEKRSSKKTEEFDLRAKLDTWRKNKIREEGGRGDRSSESQNTFRSGKRTQNLSESSERLSHTAKKLAINKLSSAVRVKPQFQQESTTTEREQAHGQDRFLNQSARWTNDRREGHWCGAGDSIGVATVGKSHWKSAMGGGSRVASDAPWAGQRGAGRGATVASERAWNCVKGGRGGSKAAESLAERHWDSPKGGRGRGVSEPSRGDFHQAGRDRGPRLPGFHRLTEWTSLDPDAVVNVLANSRNGFAELMHSQIRPDIMRLVITLLAKACAGDFKENKTAVLAAACDARFQSALALHLSSMHTDENARRHDASADTFAQLLLFCETAVTMLPVTAAERLGATLTFLGVAMDNVIGFQRIVLADKLRKRLQCLQEQVKEKRAKRAAMAQPESGRNELLRVLPPPNDYRQLPIFPTAAEVTTRQRAFVRPNIVDGAYQDAEHYLDVQFRLLREDFVQPLREGICALAAGDERRSGSVRVYRDVTFLGQMLSNDRVGMVVQFTPIPRMRWEQSKRLMFGSLLCFSRDNFVTVLFATVMERKVEHLQKGQVSVEMATPTEENLIDHQYMMLESEVFFAPYHHVLQALQKMPSDQFPMSKYVVAVSPQTDAPRYLRDKPGFQYRIRDGDTMYRVFPLNDASWPAEMSLNESQREAFKAALTREFVVIQGPPGTGKTHVGLMIARTLITNVPILIGNETHRPDHIANPANDTGREERVAGKHDQAPVHYNRMLNEKDPSHAPLLPASLEEEDLTRQSPILVVCYTNHALDQFLEGLLDTTEKIVRVGGQSRSERLAPLNLKERRLRNRTNGNVRGEHVWLGRNIHASMSELMARMRVVHKDLKDLDERRGVVSIECIEHVYMHQNLEAFCDKDGWLDNEIFLDWCQMGEGMDGLPGVPEPGIELEEDRDPDNPEEAHIADSDDEQAQNEDEYQLDRNVVVDVGITYAVDFQSVKNELAELSQLIDRREDGERMMIESMRRHEDLWVRHRFFSRWVKLVQPIELGNIEQLLRTHVRLWELNAAQRRACYEHWVRLLRAALRRQLLALEADYRRQARRYEETKQMEDLQLMKSVDVVGMTTTMAAKLQPLLQALRPRIVIVEEAAEVTESHIVVALTHHCQQLILIGDHQQLRPNTATYRLARDYHLDISLFERMLRNGLHCSRLAVQHRMRPEIARLVAPAIYPDLANHESVERFEPVLGVTRSMLFFTHDNREQEVGETSSKQNMFEGDLVLAFCRYLLQQGYAGEQVTILTTYSGQMFYMREARNRFPSLFEVKITIVDNYQGEENDIILLSLVRNNTENKIGFLNTENRVCVALSRAKRGLYIFGNMVSLVASSTIWPKIRDELVEQGALVERLPLQCQVHVDQFTDIANAADFHKVPEGGCRLSCDTVLLCGHRCKRLCHGDDRTHSLHKCMERCTRVPPECPLQHGCPRLCHEKCGDCQVPVQRNLSCGHNTTLSCHVDVDTFACLRAVAAVDPPCGHFFEKPCHVRPADQKCPHPCEVRILCGHSCGRKCHVEDDPDHIKYQCRRICARNNAGCRENHACSRRCFEPCGDCQVQVVKTPTNCQHKTTVKCSLPEGEIICLQRCARTLPCTHPCPRPCSKECGWCQVMVVKTLNVCKHETWMLCYMSSENRFCRAGCQRVLACCHRCPKLCKLPCIPVTECEQPVPEAATLVCGHTISLPCNIKTKGLPADSELLLQRCTAPCAALLGCGHVCPGSCGERLQGRVHVGCKERCSRVLVCGHVCTSACADACPPCTKPCVMFCRHSYCGLKCGVPCNPCEMWCTRQCPHARCGKRCGQQCNSEPCSRPCPKKLRCRHPCMGFCGEPCPPLCRKCRPDEANEILFGNEDEPNARFVVLEECGHSIEARGMTDWLLQNAGEVKMLRCPRCSCEIISTQRYKDQVRRALIDIQVIKKKIFGGQQENEANRGQILRKLQGLKPLQVQAPPENQGGWEGRGRRRGRGRGRGRGLGWARVQRNQYRRLPALMDMVVQPPTDEAVDNLTLEEDKLYQVLVDKLKTEQGKRRIWHSCTDLETIRVKTDALLDVHETLKAAAPCDEKAKSALQERANRLLRSLRHRERLSAEEVRDFGMELRRLQRIETLFRLKMGAKGIEGEVQTACANALSVLLSQLKYSDNQDSKAENMLKDIAAKCRKHSEVVTRQMIVKAMHMSPGHWFKCPNGHLYVIGECGGAVVESRCPECNAVIGGSGHRLRADNSVATEMDGATRSAYDMNVAVYRPHR